MPIITNTNVSTDLAPEISIDVESRLVSNINKLREVLGVTEMRSVPEGTRLKRYITTAGTLAAQVGEGEEIALTKVTRVEADPIIISFNKYRKLVTAEAIQKVGRDIAINETDDAVVAEIRKGIKDLFFTSLVTGAANGTAGATLQAACANAWGALQTKFEDIDATPIFFLNPADVANYLGTATITTQEAFGLTYLENFLGLGTAILSSKIAANTVVATVRENINGAFIPTSGAVGTTFGLTSDSTGLVGMTHTPVTHLASLETFIISGVTFYTEDASGVFKCTIGA